MRELSEAGGRKLMINLDQTALVNELALRVLIAGHNSYAEGGAKIKLCAVNQRIQSIFEVTGLFLKFEVYDTEEEALESFK